MTRASASSRRASRRRHLAVRGERLLVKCVVVVRTKLCKHLQFNEPGGADKVGDRSRGDEDQSALGGDSTRFAAVLNVRISIY